MKRLISAFAALMLVGCTQADPATTARLTERAHQPVICAGDEDCAVKWGRALKWVRANSAYKLRIVNESVISTMGPLPNSCDIAYEAIKTPLGGGRAQIDLSAGCDNFLGCHPYPPIVMKGMFAEFVTGQ